MDAVGRLREKAQNEATCIALNNECRLLRQQLAECKSKWEHFENSVAEKSMQCLSLENQLAECQKELHDEMNRYDAANKALAECQRERDELKTWLEDQVCEAKDFAYKLEGKTVELASVTKQRDELVEYKRDADRWNGISALMFACSLVELTQDEDGGYCISATEPVENYLPASWSGDTPEAAIDAALAKLGADKTGEV